MTANEMIELRMRTPFVPFEVHLRDGSSIRVEHPYVLSTGRSSSSCVIHENDHLRFVPYRDVTQVVMLTPNGA
jgi:hypothetical protein